MSRQNHNAHLKLSTQEYTTYMEALTEAGLMPVPIYLAQRHDDKNAKGWSTAAWSNQHWAQNLWANEPGAAKAKRCH